MPRPELLPCPFCGSPATWVSHTGCSNHVWIKCSNLNCRVDVQTKKQYLNADIETAAKDWNTRAPIPSECKS